VACTTAPNRVAAENRATAGTQASPTGNSLPPGAAAATCDGLQLLPQKRIRHAPRIVAFEDRHLLASAHMKAFAHPAPANTTTRLIIVRPGRPLSDPHSGQRLGYLTRCVGRARITG